MIWSDNISRTHRWRHFCLRHQIAMQDTSPLARANHLPVRNIFRKIVNAFGGYRSRSSQHGFCRCQNLITECRTQHQGQILKTVRLCVYFTALLQTTSASPLQTQVSHSVHKVLMFELFLKAGRLYSALILFMSFGSTSQSKFRNRHVSLFGGYWIFKPLLWKRNNVVLLCVAYLISPLMWLCVYVCMQIKKIPHNLRSNVLAVMCFCLFF